MTFLEALYGGQYFEIHQKGRDGNKARFNSNLLLSAMVILFIFAVIMVSITFFPDFNDSLNRSIRKIFGRTGGRVIGKLVALPLLAIIYFVINVSVGSKESFNAKVETFMNYPEEIKKKANRKLLTPFFILLVLVFGLAISNL